MDPFGRGALLAVAAYLVGSLPFGYLTGRLVAGIDIREHGSGNIGATNVGRVLGNKWGLVVLVLDFLKGLLPVTLLTGLFLPPDAANRTHWQVAAGIATILGHMFPLWLRFRGGKGVATSLGVVACLAVWPTVIAGAVFLIAFAICRFMSLASILGALAFCVAQVARSWGALFSDENWSLTAFSLMVPALIVVRHRANIARLLRGEEKRYGHKTAETPIDEASPSDRPKEQSAR